MNFIVVNDRTPKETETCYVCHKSLEKGYCREFGTALYYCGYRCLRVAIQETEILITRAS